MNSPPTDQNGYFVIEKNVQRKKAWALPEYVKNLVETLEPDESFSFPIESYLPIKRFIERNQKGWNKKFSIRKIYEGGRIWRIV